jgi:hypothetical protein
MQAVSSLPAMLELSKGVQPVTGSACIHCYGGVHEAGLCMHTPRPGRLSGLSPLYVPHLLTPVSVGACGSMDSLHGLARLRRVLCTFELL